MPVSSPCVPPTIPECRFTAHSPGRRGGRFLPGLQVVFDTQAFRIDAELESAEQGFAAGTFHHHIRQTGRDFHSARVVHCRFEGGCIRHYRFYEDTAALEEAMACQRSAHCAEDAL